jgi:hypothetical protein
MEALKALKADYTNYKWKEWATSNKGETAKTATMLVDKTFKFGACVGMTALAFSTFFQHAGVGVRLGQQLKSLGEIRFVCWTGRFLLCDMVGLPKAMIKQWKGDPKTKKEPQKFAALMTAALLTFEACWVSSEWMKIASSRFANLNHLGEWAARIGKMGDYTLVGMFSTTVISNTVARYNQKTIAMTTLEGKEKLSKKDITTLKSNLEQEQIQNQIDALDGLESGMELVNYSIQEQITQFPGMEGVSIGLGFATTFLNLWGIRKTFQKEIATGNVKQA